MGLTSALVMVSIIGIKIAKSYADMDVWSLCEDSML